MIVSVILAMARNRVIGHHGKLPWHLPDDLRNFRRLTMGKPVIMGRHTWISLPNGLPGRRCIAIASEPLPGDCEVAPDPDSALALCRDAQEVMVIGGVRVFQHFLPRCHRLYLTRVEADIDGTVRLPDLDLTDFEVLSDRQHPADARHAYAFRFQEFRRGTAHP